MFVLFAAARWRLTKHTTHTQKQTNKKTKKGTWAHDAKADGDVIVLTSADGKRVVRVPYSQAKTPAELAPALKAAGAQQVWECTGVFLTRATLAPYFGSAGAKKVVVSAPVKDAEPVLNIVVGCNDVSLFFLSVVELWRVQTKNHTNPLTTQKNHHQQQPKNQKKNLYDAAKDDIVTAASCTTNCLAPVVRVVHEQLGISHGCITTIHNLTNTQVMCVWLIKRGVGRE